MARNSITYTLNTDKTVYTVQYEYIGKEEQEAGVRKSSQTNLSGALVYKMYKNLYLAYIALRAECLDLKEVSYVNGDYRYTLIPQAA